MTRLLIWNEFRQERDEDPVRRVYPDGIHHALAEGLKSDGTIECETATLDEPDQGLSDDRLDRADVLMWWGHRAHHEVRDDLVDRVRRRVLEGMGLIVLHSSHFSKIFITLMGASCALNWQLSGKRERLWVASPKHPIAAGIGPSFDLPQTEMYGEPFDVPPPDELVFISWFETGEVFRSGCCWRRGRGRVFYFRPGHETFPIYHDEHVLRVLANACHWASSAQ